ncbi:cyclic diguanylate phosphodiesterase [Plesiomonas shigelloides]|uniref:cyclic diguanylate phosphodiesterase n=1 Tax=Plesiomonas shigelloides TaxID=703 RepID=UPI00288712BB|nr:cyclic diguanylate phosphodiesterase [Plesiomonas shigelloides]MDT1011582.1 cyclic diguanylate phosphodiesterase [Plesiomonas shigelloides]
MIELVKKSLLSRIVIAFFVFILMISVGWMAIVWQAKTELKQETERRLQIAITQFDYIFERAEQAANNIASSADLSCSDATVKKMLYQVITIPYVRNVNIALNNNIYCTILSGKKNSDFELANYYEGKLYLMNGSSVTPGSPLVAFRQTGPEGLAVLVGIDGLYLHQTLNLLSNHLQIVVRIGNKWMTADGAVYSGPLPQKKIIQVMESDHYPYEVLTQISSRKLLWYAINNSHASIAVFILIGLLFAYITYRYLSRVVSPISMLARAVEQNEFVPYMQPIVRSQDFGLHGCEVLMRWQHPQLGLIPPNQFIPLAEESALIVPMTRSLMHQVRTIFAAQAALLPPNFHFGFNISYTHFKNKDIVTDCRDFLAAFPQGAITLALEITEREMITDNPMTREIFTELHELGILFALDDFGTGNSSLSYLQTFHIDSLKIDQMFIKMIGENSPAEHIVDNVIDLANRLKLITVAEGVETMTQIRHLQALNINLLQGYFFGKPVTCTDFIKKHLVDKIHQ